PAQAAQALPEGKIQAYVGYGMSFSGAPPGELQAIESLGSVILLRTNPSSPPARDDAAAFAGVAAGVAGPSRETDFLAHPHPVTPFHGDYLHHVDLAAATAARMSASGTPSGDLKITARGRLAQHHPEWSARDGDWDAEIDEVDAGELVAAEMFAVNGWLAPPW